MHSSPFSPSQTSSPSQNKHPFVPFVPLPALGKDGMMWTVKFYEPKHCGDRDRLERLEEQTRIIMRMATSLQHTLKQQARNECLRSDWVKEQIQTALRKLVNVYRVADYSDEEEEKEAEEDESRIACLFTRKRLLLHFINFILENEPELAERHKRSSKQLTDLVQQDTEDWMQILDYIQTVKNPNYLQM